MTNEAHRPTVFVVDDDAYRDSIVENLREIGLVVKSSSSVREFLDALHPVPPSCVVLDLQMAMMSGLDLQGYLNEMQPPIPIVFISGYADISLAVKVMKQGAVDFMEKPCPQEQLLSSVCDALRIDELRRCRWNAQNLFFKRMATLTSREREVMKLALDGFPNKLIGRELAISYRTVEQHRRRVVEKFGVRSIAELLRLNFGKAGATGLPDPLALGRGAQPD